MFNTETIFLLNIFNAQLSRLEDVKPAVTGLTVYVRSLKVCKTMSAMERKYFLWQSTPVLPTLQDITVQPKPPSLWRSPHLLSRMTFSGWASPCAQSTFPQTLAVPHTRSLARGGSPCLAPGTTCCMARSQHIAGPHMEHGAGGRSLSSLCTQPVLLHLATRIFCGPSLSYHQSWYCLSLLLWPLSSSARSPPPWPGHDQCLLVCLADILAPPLHHHSPFPKAQTWSQVGISPHW